MDINLLLKDAIEQGASDVHLKVGTYPVVRVNGILKPLNHKLGKQCFNLGPGSGSEVVVLLEAGCKEPAILSRLDTLPPAALIEAPQSRREAVLKNPETLKKISM